MVHVSSRLQQEEKSRSDGEHPKRRCAESLPRGPLQRGFGFGGWRSGRFTVDGCVRFVAVGEEADVLRALRDQQGGGRQCDGVHHQTEDDPGNLPAVGHAHPGGHEGEGHHPAGMGQKQQPGSAPTLAYKPAAHDGGCPYIEGAAEHDAPDGQGRIEDGDVDREPCHRHGAETDDDQRRNQHGARAIAVNGPTHGRRRPGCQQAPNGRGSADERPAPAGFIGDEGHENGEGQAAGRVADEHAAAGGAQHDPPVVEGSAPGYVGDQDVHVTEDLIGYLPERVDGVIAKPRPRRQLLQGSANAQGLKKLVTHIRQSFR